MKNGSNPRFAIIDTMDAPIKNNVAEWRDGIGYCYMSRLRIPERKDFDGMNPKRPTPVEDFGFAVIVRGDEATFVRALESIATYEDGSLRKWQDRSHGDSFTLPLVKIRVVSKAARLRKAETV